MARTDYLPTTDGDLLIWYDHFKTNLMAQQAVLKLSDADIATVTSDGNELHEKVFAANAAAAAAHHANHEKKASSGNILNRVRGVVRRIKSQNEYTDALGRLLGIVGSEANTDLSTTKPVLTAKDQTGGVVLLRFQKYHSHGVNIYCQRDDESDFVFLARDTQTSYLDNRPLLMPGKPEQRRYTAVYIYKDVEVGAYSDDLVVTCAP